MAERRFGGRLVAVEEAHDMIFDQYSDEDELESSSDGLSSAEESDLNDHIAGIIDTESSAASSRGEGEQDDGQSAQSSSSHDNSDQLIADSVRGIAPGGAQRGARGQDRRGARQRGRGRGAGRAVWRGRGAARGRGANRTRGRGGVRGRGHAPCTQQLILQLRTAGTIPMMKHPHILAIFTLLVSLVFKSLTAFYQLAHSIFQAFLSGGRCAVHRRVY